ncbi:MAG: hypothetical protein WBA07_18225 [Rivularia sp. (in: cyanobacteria)]
MARNQDYSAVRLDAVKKNQKLLKFYKKSGYQQVDELTFTPEDKYEDASVFEKLLR